MKKRILIIIVVLLIVSGVFLLSFNQFNKNNEDNKLSKKMESASQDYFEKYISANDSTNVYTVTLEDLNKVSSTENYDLKGLENCNKSLTKAEITINYKTGKPKNTKIKLKC